MHWCRLTNWTTFPFFPPSPCRTDENEQSLYDRNQMFLFSEDEDKRVSSLLSRLANYDDAIQPVEVEPGAPGAENGGARPKPKQKANLGALTGVYLPCIQNIFGVIIFIRMTWMTGTAGVPAFFAIVLLCCLVTLCTVSVNTTTLGTRRQAAARQLASALRRAMVLRRCLPRPF